MLQILDRSVVSKLEQQSIKEINDFTEMDEEERKRVLEGRDIEKIAKACNRYPAVSLECKVKDKAEDEVKIEVVLERDEELDNEMVISSYYPVQKE